MYQLESHSWGFCRKVAKRHSNCLAVIMFSNFLPPSKRFDVRRLQLFPQILSNPVVIEFMAGCDGDVDCTGGTLSIGWRRFHEDASPIGKALLREKDTVRKLRASCVVRRVSRATTSCPLIVKGKGGKNGPSGGWQCALPGYIAYNSPKWLNYRERISSTPTLL